MRDEVARLVSFCETQMSAVVFQSRPSPCVTKGHLGFPAIVRVVLRRLLTQAVRLGVAIEHAGWPSCTGARFSSARDAQLAWGTVESPRLVSWAARSERRRKAGPT